MNYLAKSLSRGSLMLAMACLMAGSVSGQSTRKQLRTANKFFKQENYRAALPYYDQVLTADPNNAKALYFAGISYLTFDKEKSADYLYRAAELNPKVDKELEYWLGRTDHINYRFDNAIEHFQNYQKTIKPRNVERKEEVAQLIQYAKNAKREVANPKDVFVKNLGGDVNTAFSEHSPVISSDYNYLLFTSRSEEATGGKAAADGEYYEDIFETTRTGEDSWEKPRIVPGALNSAGHDASIQLFDNDTKLLLYQSVNNGDIMVSERQPDGSWGTPKSISDKVNTRDFESDAYITPDGTTLFFSTSHYSENGDLDIYMVQRDKNGNWGNPKSLGKTINSRYDEDSPYLSADGTLFFASRGHNSMGGYDIFASKYDSVARRWARPENLGSPINTPDDDTYYRLAPDGSYAYLSSYRIGGYGEKDIYTINYIKNAQVKGRVLVQGDSTLALPGVELTFNGQQADNRPISYRDVSKPDSATYSVNMLSGRNYQVQLSLDGQVLETQEFEVPVVLDDTTTIRKDFFVTLEDSTAARIAKLTPSATVGDIKMENIYFATDKYDLRPEAVQELDRIAEIMKANPTLNISIEGHTDSRASDSYNMTLGQNRADAAFDYLVGKGISAKRMVTVSYGESRPAVPNTSADNMQLNRRTIFRVLKRDEIQQGQEVQ
ncbi:OmpA family protein [Pontibacter litorisediminis]|uniref:OmpA family protein n=1 Tax=Pontibacter litorisediminis TaxID=1846260 RepID=UPI0023EB7A56|nr:OmpA family protein [Pontibacter litorisediminis]